MKPIIWIRLFLCCAAIGVFRSIEAQNIHSVLEEGEILRFDRTVLNVGTLTEDDTTQTYRFVCTNVSDEAVKITRVRTTCGCTAADFHTGEILPGETRVIALNYTPKNHPGTIDTNAFIYLSSSDSTSVACLTLRGNVLPGADEWARYPYVMGELRLKQNRMEFREVAAGKRPSERILCGNSGDKPLRLSVLHLPKFATFCMEPEVISSGGEADIVVTIDASLIPADKDSSFTFPLVIEGLDAQPSERTLNIKVNRIK